VLRTNEGKQGSDNERFNTSTDEHSIGQDDHSTNEYKRDLKKGNNNILVRPNSNLRVYRSESGADLSRR
jgi:hypothetical protein